MAKKKPPKEGTRAWEEGLWQNPTFVKNTLEDLLDRCERGDKAAAERAAKILAGHPELRPLARQLENLMKSAEEAWIKAVGFGDALREIAARDEVTAIKAELLGPSPNILEKILASSLAVSYIAQQRAALVAATKADSPGVAALRDRRLESAQKRLNAAVKAWELVSQKKAKGVRPGTAVKLFAPDEQTSASRTG